MLAGPQDALFDVMQRVRRPLVQWLAVHEEHVEGVMTRVVEVALHAHLQIGSDVRRHWELAGNGVYLEPHLNIKVDVQSAEVLCNEQETRPVPESMSKAGDFELVFGKEALRCSFKFRHEHRQWVQIVGEEHELLEWDTPHPYDQGVGVPRGVGTADMPPDSGPEELFGDGIVFNEVTYSRPFRHYLVDMQELAPPPPAPTETWVAELLQPVLEACYPKGPMAMDFPIFLPDEELAEDASECKLIGLAYPDKDFATWKEFVVLRHHGVVCTWVCGWARACEPGDTGL